MPSHPPDTELCNDQYNAALWRDLSRLYEDFAGGDELLWLQRQQSFKTVVRDMLSRLEETV